MNITTQGRHEKKLKSMNQNERDNWLVVKSKVYLSICIITSLIALVVSKCLGS